MLRAEPPVTDATLRTLGALANHERDGLAWPSKRLIAEALGYTERAVQKHFQLLESAGYITAARELVIEGVPANRQPRVWRLNVTQGRTAVPPIGTPRGEPQRHSGENGAVIAPYIEPSNEAEGTRVNISDAQAELGGGIGNPPPKRFPKQCSKHQNDINEDSCPGCGSMRRAEEDREKLAAADRERRIAEERAHRRAGITACDLCDGDGWVEDEQRRGVVRCAHPLVHGRGTDATRQSQSTQP